MVAKITSGGNLYGALAYNHNKVDAGRASVIFTQRIIVPPDGNVGIGTCLRSFEPYLLANRRTEKPVLHISLNPDPNDKLSDEKLTGIACEYMQRMGYGEQPFIVYKHEDIDRRHIHIVSLRVDETGRKLDHNYEYRRSMEICRELGTKHGLRQVSSVRDEDAPYLRKVNYEAGDVKRQIGNTLRSVIKDYRYQTFGEYSALLACFNIDVKQVRAADTGSMAGDVGGAGQNVLANEKAVGRLVSGAGSVGHNGQAAARGAAVVAGQNGQVAASTTDAVADDKPKVVGLIYSATDGQGNVVGTPFKSSLFGKAFGNEAIEKRITRNQEEFKAGKFSPMIKGAVAGAMRAAADAAVSSTVPPKASIASDASDNVSTDRSTAIQMLFEQRLKEKNIDTVFRRNEQGRIYGVTFIDHARREVYNGSRLGKEFSANVFNDLFNGQLQKLPDGLRKYLSNSTTTTTDGRSTSFSGGRQSAPAPAISEPNARRASQPRSVAGTANARSASQQSPVVGTDQSETSTTHAAGRTTADGGSDRQPTTAGGGPPTTRRAPHPSGADAAAATAPELSPGSAIASTIEELFTSGDSFGQHGPDYQEEEFARRMRRKKRRKKGHSL